MEKKYLDFFSFYLRNYSISFLLLEGYYFEVSTVFISCCHRGCKQRASCILLMHTKNIWQRVRRQGSNSLHRAHFNLTRAQTLTFYSLPWNCWCPNSFYLCMDFKFSERLVFIWSRRTVESKTTDVCLLNFGLSVCFTENEMRSVVKNQLVLFYQLPSLLVIIKPHPKT